MNDAARTILEWRKNPELFVRQVLGAKPTKQQLELLRVFPKEKRIAVRSGHGTGKDACASWLILWFLVTRPHAVGVATAPTFRQLVDVLWGEVARWLRKSPLAADIEIERDIIYMKGHKRTWFVRAASVGVNSTPEEQAETLAGYHGEHLLVVVDEASGVPDPVFRPLEGMLTRPDNKVLLIGNPTRDSGYFFDAFHSTATKWRCLHWNSAESELVSNDFVQFYADKYGVDSDQYRIRVAGEFPRASSEALIPRGKIEECQRYWEEVDAAECEKLPLVVGLDVARTGPDRSVLTLRHGFWVAAQHYTYESDTMRMCEWVLEKLVGKDPVVIYVDAVGMGGPVADRLRALGLPVVDVNVGWKSSDPTQWYRLKDELWWSLRQRICQRQLALPPGSELVDELAAIKGVWVQNQLKVADKAQMRKVLGFSPDLADSLVLTEYDAEGPLIAAMHSARYKKRRYALSWRLV